MAQLVKRKGHTESFDEKKIYGSAFAALASLRMADEEAETIATMVTNDVKDAIKKKSELTSHALHVEVVKSLKKYHPDAAYLYDTHRDLS